MKIEELMTKPAATVLARDTLEVAAQRMWDGDCGVLAAIRVEESMSNQVFSVKPGEDIESAETLMAAKRVRRVPVVDADNKLIGIQSLNDIAREAVRAGSKLKEGIMRVLQTVAAICQPRKCGQKAA